MFFTASLIILLAQDALPMSGAMASTGIIGGFLVLVCGLWAFMEAKVFKPQRDAARDHDEKLEAQRTLQEQERTKQATKFETTSTAMERTVASVVNELGPILRDLVRDHDEDEEEEDNRR